MKTQMHRYIDLTYLRSISKGNKEFEQQMLTAFVEQSVIEMRKLKSALMESDWHTVYQVAHKIKPSVTFVGLHSILNKVESLEKIAKEHPDFNKIQQLISEIS